ncbi:MAG: ribonuclease III [Candidatus Nanoarchaeia archaeon]
MLHYAQDSFAEKTGVLFHNPALLLEALTHKSYATEYGLKADNQRLEVLGDAVLQLVSTDYIFSKYHEHCEGPMSEIRSAMTRQETLAKFAKHLDIHNLILLGKGEEKTGGREKISILADAFEAIIGALYLDSGLETVRKFLIPLFETLCPHPEKLYFEMNPKGALQEFLQAKYKQKPEYRLVNAQGPDHDKSFTVSVIINGKAIASATASSLKSAESAAAAQAFDILTRKEQK